MLEPCAGVSMVAKPEPYLNKVINVGEVKNFSINDTNIREAIRISTGLCINSAVWTGIKGYCRFSLALEENEF